VRGIVRNAIRDYLGGIVENKIISSFGGSEASASLYDRPHNLITSSQFSMLLIAISSSELFIPSGQNHRWARTKQKKPR
jgi:hypothetical protein